MPALFGLTHDQAFDGVFLSDGAEMFDDRTAEVFAYSFGQLGPVVPGNSETVLVRVVGFRRIDTEDQHRPGFGERFVVPRRIVKAERADGRREVPMPGLGERARERDVETDLDDRVVPQ